MKLAIVHYHLNRGGVAQVIINHLKALDGLASDRTPLQVALLYGGRCLDWPEDLLHGSPDIEITLHPLSELDYDNVRPHQKDLVEQMQAALRGAGFGWEDTILHFHNHSLGKNAALPSAIAALARSGFATLLQIHDFAEDLRPENYRRLASELTGDEIETLPGKLYPQAPHVQYAVLNRRDHSVLHAAGVDTDRLHLLPNAISDIGPLPSAISAREKLQQHFGVSRTDRFVIYPVRGIRRKNIGEALLWAALADENTSFGLTLPPLNPTEQKSYQRWKKLARKLQLKCVFELGNSTAIDFHEVLAASDLVLTTSVAEGFGLVFLETWLAGKALAGRDLPAITADFVASGMQFPGLQPGFVIPVDWFDEDQLFREIANMFQIVVASYGQPMIDLRALRDKFALLTQGGLVDFAVCPTKWQQRVVERVVGNPESRDQLREVNPAVQWSLQMASGDTSSIHHNAEIVRRDYSLNQTGTRLLSIYQQLVDRPRDEKLQPLPQGNGILDSFLDLSRFHPLRVES